MNNKAFTVIELIVVLMIIAILAGLILPAVVAAREKGKFNLIKTGEIVYVSGNTAVVSSVDPSSRINNLNVSYGIIILCSDKMDHAIPYVQDFL